MGKDSNEGGGEMKYSELFSKRHRLRPTPEGLMDEDIPERARIGLYHIVEEYFGGEHQKDYYDIYKEICKALRILGNRNVNIYTASSAIEETIMTCNWWQYYDICEVLWANPYSEYSQQKHEVDIAEKINSLFRDEQIGFELREGGIEKVGSGFIDSQIKETRYLLKEPEFKGADQHFEKAIKALNIRPKPDVENCIKDAVSAIESVGRIITNDENALLSDIIKSAVKKGAIPQPLDQTFQKLYAYRGNEPGVAHGATDISKVTADEAELILTMSAAMIIYLVKKRSQLS